jgi:hypothetical protein
MKLETNKTTQVPLLSMVVLIMVSVTLSGSDHLERMQARFRYLLVPTKITCLLKYHIDKQFLNNTKISFPGAKQTKVGLDKSWLKNYVHYRVLLSAKQMSFTIRYKRRQQPMKYPKDNSKLLDLA